jgi:hypothetical protein
VTGPIVAVSTLAGLLVDGSSSGAIDPTTIQGGLTPTARILVAALGIGAVFFILILLRRRKLRSKYALLWTGLALALGILGLFPGLLNAMSEAVGIFYPPALFLLVAVGFLFAVVIQFSWELSRLEERSRTLAEEVALLRAATPPATATDQADTAEPGPAGD